MEHNSDLEFSYNIAPSPDVLGAWTTPKGKRELALPHWGLIPSWVKEPKTGFCMINTKVETVATKPASAMPARSNGNQLPRMGSSSGN